LSTIVSITLFCTIFELFDVEKYHNLEIWVTQGQWKWHHSLRIWVPTGNQR